MEIRKTALQDLDRVMALYAAARAFMRTSGNPNQWPEHYPPRELIAREIEQGFSYICLDDGAIAAVFSLVEGEDPTYQSIYDGAWLKDGPYVTVHRICVAKQGQGVGAFCLQWCLEQCGNLRIDTHRDNQPMQALLKKCGFTYCGRIFIADGSERLAFQKTK